MKNYFLATFWRTQYFILLLLWKWLQIQTKQPVQVAWYMFYKMLFLYYTRTYRYFTIYMFLLVYVQFINIYLHLDRQIDRQTDRQIDTDIQMNKDRCLRKRKPLTFILLECHQLQVTYHPSFFVVSGCNNFCVNIVSLKLFVCSTKICSIKLSVKLVLKICF